MPLEYTKTGREYTEGKEDTLPAVFANLEWASVEERRTIGMMPGMAVQKIIDSMKGRHTHYAISHELAPFGLYGIASEFKNASVTSYWIDSGDSVTCIAVNATSKPEVSKDTGLTVERMTHGICARCGKAPAHFMPLRLCDECHEGLSKIPAPKDEKAPAKEWNDYAAARRAYLEKVEA